MNPYESGDAPPVLPQGQALTITRIDPMSVARMTGGMYGAMGLLISAFALLMAALVVVGALLGMSSGVEDSGAALFAAGPPLVMAVMAPLLYGGIGFIGGALMAVFYNLAAGWFGGISFTLG